jgi:cold shock protein
MTPDIAVFGGLHSIHCILCSGACRETAWRTLCEGFCFVSEYSTGAISMAEGTIKKLTDKGFGFIAGANGELFFHSSSVIGTSFENLREGQRVEYEEGRGPKGPRAQSVKVI